MSHSYENLETVIGRYTTLMSHEGKKEIHIMYYALIFLVKSLNYIFYYYTNTDKYFFHKVAEQYLHNSWAFQHCFKKKKEKKIIYNINKLNETKTQKFTTNIDRNHHKKNHKYA